MQKMPSINATVIKKNKQKKMNVKNKHKHFIQEHFQQDANMVAVISQTFRWPHL